MNAACVVHDFQVKLKDSQSEDFESMWVDFYRKLYPSSLQSLIAIRDDCPLQRMGIDRILFFGDGRQKTIDEKIREKGYDDILLEIYSQTEFNWKPYREQYKKQIFAKQLRWEKKDFFKTFKIKVKQDGWAIDTKKRSDYIAYAIPKNRKAYFFPYDLLRQTTRTRWETWVKEGKAIFPVPAANKGYVTLSLAIQWDVLQRELGRMMERSFEVSLTLPPPEEVGEQTEYHWN